MIQCLHSTRSPVWLRLQHQFHQIFACIADIQQIIIKLFQVTLFVMLQDFQLVGASEEETASNQVKHQGSTTENVTFKVVTLTSQYFWRYIARCPTSFV